MSICIYCGEDHGAALRACPKTGKAIGNAGVSPKTMFGMPSTLATPVRAPPSPTASPPRPGAPPLPSPSGKPALPGNRGNTLPLGRTMIGAPPALPVPAQPASLRLPSEQEARENPNLVVSLETTHAARPALPPPARGADSAGARPAPGPAVTPVDLPAVDGMARCDEPKDAGPVEEKRNARDKAGHFDRFASDVRSAFALLRWAATTYARRPGPWFFLAAFLVLPVCLFESCMLAGVARLPAAAALGPGQTTVDFSARRAELAERIQASEKRGQIDEQAAAELAALTTVETAGQPPPIRETHQGMHEGARWLHETLTLFLQGLLLFGLAFPVACGALAVATIDEQSGAAVPGFADVWPILTARKRAFLLALLPAAVLVALGDMLFLLPGLVLSLLFLFVPLVVLFEKKTGRVALSRSIELVRKDTTRVGLVFLTFALAGFATALLTELLLPPSGSRAWVFLHHVGSGLLAVAVLPIPALVLARIYLDLRGRIGASAERLARAARS